MSEPESEIDAQVTDLISKKIAAEDADSGWVVAYAAMRIGDFAERADNPVVQFPVAPDRMSSPANHPEKRAEVCESGLKGAMQCQ